MTRCIKTNQDTGGSKVRQTPVPASRGSSTVVRGHKGLVGAAEAPSLSGANGQPDKVQEEVEHHDSGGEPENISEVTR